MTHKVHEYDGFIGQLIQQEGVQTLISRGFRLTGRIFIPPRIWITPTCGSSTAGQTWLYDNGESDIELSSWILISGSETYRVLRHEFAHTVKHYAGLEGKSHGKGFTIALKAVSLRRWRKDRHWHSDSQIDEERLRCHPRLKLKV